MISLFLKFVVSLVPFWYFKRFLLQHLYGFKIHPSARIGFSYIFPKYLAMGPNSRIGHGNVCKGISRLCMDDSSLIGRLNWISGFPKLHSSNHFLHKPDRDPCLLMGKHSALTSRHIVDCTDSVFIGEFVTIAGFRSQILTHSIDISNSIQSSAPVFFGAYSFIGTSVVILPGAVIPPKSVVAAGSVVAKHLKDEFTLYGGVPAKPIKKLAGSEKYFLRSLGYVE